MSLKDDIWGKTIVFCVFCLVKEMEEWEEVVSMQIHFCCCYKIPQKFIVTGKWVYCYHDNLETKVCKWDEK